MPNCTDQTRAAVGNGAEITDRRPRTVLAPAALRANAVHGWTEEDNERAIPTIPGQRPAPDEETPHRPVPAPRPASATTAGGAR